LRNFAAGGVCRHALYDARGIQQSPLERNIMKTTYMKIKFARLPKDYTGLCRMLTPRPIHDKVDFENVTEITDAMAGHKLTADQEDYFDLLFRRNSVLVSGGLISGFFSVSSTEKSDFSP
jgi:hypothetical protein